MADQIWTFRCSDCVLVGSYRHRHDRDRQRARHAADHPDHTVNVGRTIPGQPRKATR